MCVIYIWGCLLIERLESKQRKLAKQIETILRITNPQRHIQTNTNIKSKHERPQTKLVAKEDQERDRPRPTNEVRPHRRGKTHDSETGLGVEAVSLRMGGNAPMRVNAKPRLMGLPSTMRPDFIGWTWTISLLIFLRNKLLFEAFHAWILCLCLCVCVFLG